MIEKCLGCNAIIQFDDSKKPGYIKREVYQKRKEENKEILCERCFRLKHYNEVEKVTIDEEGFLDLVKENLTNNMLVCYIVDLFDLSGTFIKNLNDIFPHNHILVIGNKYDLFMRSNRPTKLKKYLNDLLDEYDIKPVGTVITSANDEKTAIKVYEAINKIIVSYNLSKEVFFFGVSNSGKTTLLKSIGSLFDNEETKDLLVSKAVSTTLGLTRIDLGDLVIVDSPGLVNDKEFTYYLNKKTIDYIMPKDVVKATVFQLNPYQKIFIEGFASVSLLKSENKKTSLAFYLANNIKLHRTKYEDNDDFYNDHLKDLFSKPSKSERAKLGVLVKREFDLTEDEEIIIAGLGFIETNSKCHIEVKTFEKINVEIRKKMI